MKNEFSDSLIENILEHSPTAIFVTDENGLILFVNHEAYELFGYSKEELLGQEVEILLPLHMRTKHRCQRADFIAHNSGPRKMGEGRDLFGMHKNGSYIPIEIGLNPMSIKGTQYVIATIINITERKRKQDQQLNQLINNLERSNKELEEYAHIISHDLQNPLSVILSYSEILENELPNENQKELVDRIRKCATRMNKLISNLLELSRMTSKKSEFTVIDLNELLNSLIAELKILPNYKELEVEVDRLGTIEANATLVGLLFQNLLINASKYCKPGRSAIVHISGRVDGEFYSLDFKDNGIGMNDTSTIFSLFKRLPTSDESVPGYGIGLAMSKKIVELHSGEISVQSVEGVGTTFSVKLPIKQNFTLDDQG